MNETTNNEVSNKMKKITLATVKSFIRKNSNNLFINVKSSFDGMTDGCEPCNNGFMVAVPAQDHIENNLGINGAWVVGSSRDYFTPYFKDGFSGIEVYNCCGKFILAVKSIQA